MCMYYVRKFMDGYPRRPIAYVYHNETDTEYSEIARQCIRFRQTDRTPFRMAILLNCEQTEDMIRCL